MKRTYLICVTQLVEKLYDPDDREFLPAGENGEGSTCVYSVEATTKKNALDQFHDTIPIGCLEDFFIQAAREGSKVTSEWSVVEQVI